MKVCTSLAWAAATKRFEMLLGEFGSLLAALLPQGAAKATRAGVKVRAMPLAPPWFAHRIDRLVEEFYKVARH